MTEPGAVGRSKSGLHWSAVVSFRGTVLGCGAIQLGSRLSNGAYWACNRAVVRLLIGLTKSTGHPSRGPKDSTAMEPSPEAIPNVFGPHSGAKHHTRRE